MENPSRKWLKNCFRSLFIIMFNRSTLNNFEHPFEHPFELNLGYSTFAYRFDLKPETIISFGFFVKMA